MCCWQIRGDRLPEGKREKKAHLEVFLSNKAHNSLLKFPSSSSRRVKESICQKRGCETTVLLAFKNHEKLSAWCVALRVWQQWHMCSTSKSIPQLNKDSRSCLLFNQYFQQYFHQPNLMQHLFCLWDNARMFRNLFALRKQRKFNADPWKRRKGTKGKKLRIQNVYWGENFNSLTKWLMNSISP